MQTSRISRSLLTRVLSVYFLLTFFITCIHVAGEYFNTKRYLVDELENQHHTFAASLTRAMWEFNNQQINALADGLINIPSIAGIVIRDEDLNVIVELGSTLPADRLPDPIGESQRLPEQQGVFGHYSPLVFEFADQSSVVGDVALYSNRDIAINRLKVSLAFLIGNAVIKSTLLILLFSIAFSRMLNQPFRELVKQIDSFHIDDLEQSRLQLENANNNEFGLLEDAYNRLIDNLQEHQSDLRLTEQKLRHANRQLDEQNDLLEQEVARKTSRLSKLMMDLEQRRQELEQRQGKLEYEIRQRKLTESTLKRTNNRLQESLDTLQRAQHQLVESEKMASLGGLVAGIAHDVNTPIGIGVTATSFMAERTEQLAMSLEEQSLTQGQLKQFIDDARESVRLLDSNLHRAKDLIESFKQVAVDQTSDALREIPVGDYVKGVVQSLQPKLKHTQHEIIIDCDPELKVRCLSGALAQIITNMILNSLLHGFEGMDKGEIRIDVHYRDEHLHCRYADNGSGVDEHQLTHLFDPFFTTKADQGGSGLGTHIVFNLVTQTLQGEISASSKPGEGLQYDFHFPVTRIDV